MITLRHSRTGEMKAELMGSAQQRDNARKRAAAVEPSLQAQIFEFVDDFGGKSAARGAVDGAGDEFLDRLRG